MPIKAVFHEAMIGNIKMILYSGGDIYAVDHNTGHQILLGNCSKDDDTIPTLIDLLQCQMNCVRGI